MTTSPTSTLTAPAAPAAPSARTPRSRRTRRSRISARALLVAVAGALLAIVAGALPASAVTQSSAAATFRAAGITWSSSGGCTDRYNASCTSFEGLRQATVDGAVTLKRASGCALNITGGTETGHASGTYSHWNGYKLDFARTTCLTNWVRSRYAYQGLRGDGSPLYKAPSGNLYADEGNHWDVTYFTCGC